METVNHFLRESFGIGSAPANVAIEGYAEANDNAPYAEDSFIFDPELLKQFMVWWSTRRGPGQNDGLAVSGPTGCGKTTFVKQVFARLNVPVFEYMCFPETEPDYFFGSMGLIGGNTIWQDGPAVKAAKQGGIFLIEEADRLNPTTLGALSELMENRPFRIPGEGRKVEPQGLYGVVMTTNTRGGIDETGDYAGAQQQNLAVMDRFFGMEVDYPAREIEEALIESQVISTVPEKFKSAIRDLLSKHIDVAHAVREAHKDEMNRLQVVITTRGLVSWAKVTVAMALARMANPSSSVHQRIAHEALDLRVLNKAPRDAQAAVHELMDKIYGVQP
jgi:cobaltochelatase CobS